LIFLNQWRQSATWHLETDWNIPSNIPLSHFLYRETSHDILLYTWLDVIKQLTNSWIISQWCDARRRTIFAALCCWCCRITDCLYSLPVTVNLNRRNVKLGGNLNLPFISELQFLSVGVLWRLLLLSKCHFYRKNKNFKLRQKLETSTLRKLNYLSYGRWCLRRVCSSIVTLQVIGGWREFLMPELVLELLYN
jgi:hypothetical protein